MIGIGSRPKPREKKNYHERNNKEVNNNNVVKCRDKLTGNTNVDYHGKIKKSVSRRVSRQKIDTPD